jgi:hypothetical protein
MRGHAQESCISYDLSLRAADAGVSPLLNCLRQRAGAANTEVVARDDSDAMVSLQSHGLVVGVLRDQHGGAWLTSELARGPGTLLEPFRPAMEGWEELTVVGGLLPRGAVRCEVEDRRGDWHAAEVGDGAWVAVLDEPARGDAPVARYLDTRGEIVRPPLPDGVETETVGGALSACPACGASEWERVVHAPDGRYASDGDGNPTAAVCAACGHEVNLGVMISLGETTAVSDVDREQGERPAAEELARQRAAERTALAGVRFAVYELGGGWSGPRAFGGYGSESIGGDDPAGRVTNVTLSFGDRRQSHDWGDIESDASDYRLSDAEAAYEALHALLEEIEEWPQLSSDTALSLWLHEQDRAARESAANAETFSQPIPVDGEPLEFTGRRANGFTALAATVGQVQITVNSAVGPTLTAVGPRTLAAWFPRDGFT